MDSGLGGPFDWIGAGIGATRLLKKFLPDIRTWLAENNAAIAKELDPLLWGLQESLAAAWGEGLPEVPPEVLQKAPEDRNWLFQWWIDNEERFKGAADAIADGIRNVTKALKPESTEGGRRVSVLRRQEGAAVLLG